MSQPLPSAEIPAFWAEASKFLSKRDRVLRKLIASAGPAALSSRGDPFTTLSRSIVGQQISVKAAESIWQRVLGVVAPGEQALSPDGWAKASDTDLRAAGLSARKVEYLRDLAKHFLDGRVHAQEWPNMDDEQIILELTDIRGVGRWTAEMFLIFHLLRPNVLPLDDVGLIRAISLNYFSGEPVSRAEARELGESWAPWRSVATWYLWRSLDPIPVEY